MKTFLKKYNRDIVLIGLYILSSVLLIQFFVAQQIRFGHAVKDLALSVAFYFCSFFDVEVPVSVTEMPSFDILEYLLYDFEEILRRLRDMWSVVFDGDCFRSYLSEVAIFVNDFATYFMLLAPALLILGYMLIRNAESPNEKEHGERSKGLVFFEKKCLPPLMAIRAWCVSLYKHFRKKKYYLWPILLVWLVNLNMATILTEVLAYYFYFVMAFDFGSIMTQLGKALLDILIMLSSAPVVFWLSLSYAILVAVRKKIGYKCLDVREIANRQFIEDQPICIFLNGTVGTGKTTAATDMGMSIEVMFRDIAYKKLLEIDNMYPNFPWILFEDELKRSIKYGVVHSLTTCRDWIWKKFCRWRKNPCRERIFGYDTELYRGEYYDELSNRNLWKDLENYACLYFIFIIESSLLVSNYSVRVDNVLEDAGNFPRWDSDFFASSKDDSYSRHAHILDYDVLRLGKQVLADNPRRGSFEFGIVLLSELGKERGNTLTLQEVKRNDSSANQKNDLFSYAVKMCRHKATVDNFPFVYFVSDEQRPESIEADLRQLMNLVHIREKSKPRLVMPFFFVTEILHDFVYSKWLSFYKEYRYCRGDISLPVYLGHNAVAKLHNYYTRIYNIFGVSELTVEVERGTMDGDLIEQRYFLCTKKIYANRFSTDCYRGYFEEQLRKTESGLTSYPEYGDTSATTEELHFQNSYFISDMEKIQKQGEKT